MVLYNGRARQRTGSVNKNQLGLKMSGCPSKIGKSGNIIRCISRRSHCNLKVPQVGLDTVAALVILTKYFWDTLGESGTIVLVGKKETLVSDGLDTIFHPIKHYQQGTGEYAVLPPEIKAAVDTINNLKLKGQLKKGGPSVVHILGWLTYKYQHVLQENNFGNLINFGRNALVWMYALATPATVNVESKGILSAAPAFDGAFDFLSMNNISLQGWTKKGKKFGENKQRKPSLNTTTPIKEVMMKAPGFTRSFVDKEGLGDNVYVHQYKVDGHYTVLGAPTVNAQTVFKNLNPLDAKGNDFAAASRNIGNAFFRGSIGNDEKRIWFKKGSEPEIHQSSPYWFPAIYICWITIWEGEWNHYWWMTTTNPSVCVAFSDTDGGAATPRSTYLMVLNTGIASNLRGTGMNVSSYYSKNPNQDDGDGRVRIWESKSTKNYGEGELVPQWRWRAQSPYIHNYKLRGPNGGDNRRSLYHPAYAWGYYGVPAAPIVPEKYDYLIPGRVIFNAVDPMNVKSHINPDAVELFVPACEAAVGDNKGSCKFQMLFCNDRAATSYQIQACRRRIYKQYVGDLPLPPLVEPASLDQIKEWEKALAKKAATDATDAAKWPLPAVSPKNSELGFYINDNLYDLHLGTIELESNYKKAVASDGIGSSAATEAMNQWEECGLSFPPPHRPTAPKVKINGLYTMKGSLQSINPIKWYDDTHEWRRYRIVWEKIEEGTATLYLCFIRAHWLITTCDPTQLKVRTGEPHPFGESKMKELEDKVWNNGVICNPRGRQECDYDQSHFNPPSPSKGDKAYPSSINKRGYMVSQTQKYPYKWYYMQHKKDSAGNNIDAWAYPEAWAFTQCPVIAPPDEKFMRIDSF